MISRLIGAGIIIAMVIAIGFVAVGKLNPLIINKVDGGLIPNDIGSGDVNFNNNYSMEKSTKYIFPAFFIVIGVFLILPAILKAFGLKKQSVKSSGHKKEDEQEGEEEFFECEECKAQIKDEDELYECEECGREICGDCIIQFDNAEYLICKSCIDEAYPRGKEVMEKKKEEKDSKVKPIFNEKFGDKSEFD